MNARKHALPTRIVVLFLLAIFATGCTKPMFHASSLPQQYRAARHVSARHMDLSRIPRSAIPTEWIQSGDTVKVAIATGVEDSPVSQWEITVDAEGNASVPLVGPVPVAGLPPNQAAHRIRQQAIQRDVYVDPNVSLQLARRRTHQISVVGAVNKPDNYEIPVASCDLLTALSMANGLATDAETKIEIRHTQAAINALAEAAPTLGPDGPIALASFQEGSPVSVIEVDLKELDNIDPNALRLLDGSVVSVGRRTERKISVIGVVNKPMTLDLPDGEDMTLLSAIAEAGGPRLQMADKVQIVRKDPATGNPVTIGASLKDAKRGGTSNLPLAHGDIVNVVETPVTMTIDAIRSFFRVAVAARFPML